MGNVQSKVTDPFPRSFTISHQKNKVGHALPNHTLETRHPEDEESLTQLR